MADNSIQLDSGGSYLFVGNSFTFGRVDPVMSYNTANVRDLTAPVPGTTFANTTGSNPYEPHPWGGVPGLFEAFASQAGLELDVAISARNAATLQGQYLNSNPAGWDLRGNVASQAWDVVVLQDNSTQPLPSGSGSITFAAGSSTATLTIDPATDTKVETDETIGLQITANPTAYRTSAGVITGTILNDDPTGPTVDPTRPTVTLVASPNAVAEDGIPNLVYTFTRTGPTTSALTVNFAAARDGGTAPSITEYTSSFQSNGSSTTGSLSFTSGTGSIVIKAGATSATFTLDPSSDATVENDESVRLTLSTNSNYNVGTQGAVSATILNDDFAPGTDLSLSNISLSIASSAVYEDGSGNLVYQFTRSGSNTAPLTVNFSVSGTATLAGNDFTVTGANTFSSPGAADPNVESFKTYAVKLAQYATTGAADGAVPANTHANAATDVYLYETWARPNMITGAVVANTDDTTGAVTNTTTTAPEFYLTLETMTADLKAAYQGLAAANSIFAGVAPVGEAFLAAVLNGTAMRNPYAPEAGKVDLWWDDNLHASKYGSYLSGLTLFGTLTGLDPRSLGAAEHVASDLGITQAVAAALQNVAAATLGFTLDAHWTAPGQVTELPGGVTGLLATEGSFGFSDSDVADTHTIAVTALTPGSVGTFSAAVHTDTTGDGTGGSVDWLFTVDNADVAFLAPGESRVEHFLVTISDANGGSAQRDVAVTLNGTYNDAPGASMTTDPYTATEQTTLNLKSTLSVSDVDSGGGSETVTLSVGEGTLHVDAGTSGAGVSGDNTSSVTITGSLAQINALLDTDATSVVSYIDNTDTPSASTTLTLHVDDGGATATDTSIINITAVNDAPVATITPTTYSATEQTALDLKNNGLSVSDVDGNAGSETVTLSVIEGTLTVTAGGSGAIVTNSGTSSVTITGTASQINTLLNTDGTSTVSYTDGGDNPSTSTTLTLLIHDNGNTGGGDLSSSNSATINITAVNDAPVATITPASYSVTENVALDLKNNGLSVSDIDGNAGSETVTLAVNDGILNVAAGTSGASVSNSGTGSVTITGTLAQINALLNTDGASGVSYVENNSNPGTTASLSLTIHDNGNTGGGDLSSTDTAILNITQVNNGPVGAITPSSYATTENVSVDLKNNGLAVSDIDGNAGSETVTLSVTEGVLNVTAGGSGAIVNNSGTGAVTITGTVAQIDALLNTDATSAVGYVDNNDVPAACTMLTLLIHDNGNTGGGDLSSSDTATINIAAVNDAPVFTNLGEGAHPTFVENGSAVVLDGNVTVSDPELNAAGNYGGATLTLARNGGANPDDTFAATGSLDLAHSNGLGENVSLDGGATFIGTFAQPGDGTFSITFNAGATAANVAFVMQHIAYANASENPDNPTVQIDWSFSDGNTGAQGSGGAGIATGSVTVDITQVDDAPILLNVSPSSAYTIGSAGVVLSPALGVFDVDATAPSPLQGLASATVKVESGFFAGDELFVNLAISGGHFVTPDGDTTNISVQSNVLGTLILSGNDTVSHYQSVLDAVSYHSTAADPSNGGANPSRNISWQVNDGALNSQTPNPDPNNLVNETVLHFDVAPQVDLDASGAGSGFTTTFTENGAPLAIGDSDVSIVDPDNANLDAATVVLTNAKATDALSIAGALPGGIDSSIDTSVLGQITLHLSNSASLADYQTALGQVRFVNSSDTPDTIDRDITVSVTNGADSNVAHATIHVIAVDDAPLAANSNAGGSEDTPISGIVSATDVDNTPSQLSYSLVGTNGGAAHGAVVFHADGSYTYNPVHDFNGSDSFSFKANDGLLDSNVATVSLTVSPVNDAPVAASGSASGNEDTTISGTLSVADVDNTAAQLSYNLIGTNGGAIHGAVVLHADGTFSYTPALNFNGSDSFTFKANDGALDSSTATETLNVSAVNDAPVNTITASLNAFNDLDTAITGLAVNDPDAVSLTTTLHLDHGTLTVAAIGGATVGGSGTSTVTLSGSVTQINAALGAANNVVYHSEAGFAGTDHLTIISNDGGGTGAGGPLTDTDIANIFVAATSAPPHLAFGVLGGASANSPAPSPQGPAAASILNDGFLFPSQPGPAPASNPVVTFFPSGDPSSSQAEDGVHPTPLISSILEAGHVIDVNSFNPPHLASDFHIT